MEDVAGQAEEAQISSGDHGGPQDAAQQQPGSACVRECAGVAAEGGTAEAEERSTAAAEEDTCFGPLTPDSGMCSAHCAQQHQHALTFPGDGEISPHRQD